MCVMSCDFPSIYILHIEGIGSMKWIETTNYRVDLQYATSMLRIDIPVVY